MTEFPENRVFVKGLDAKTGFYPLETALKKQWSGVVEAEMKHDAYVFSSLIVFDWIGEE